LYDNKLVAGFSRSIEKIPGGREVTQVQKTVCAACAFYVVVGFAHEEDLLGSCGLGATNQDPGVYLKGGAQDGDSQRKRGAISW